MIFGYCSNCKKKTGHKRALGLGTLFAVFLTGALWLLVIPLYPKRCIACGHGNEIIFEDGGEAMVEARTWTCPECGTKNSPSSAVCVCGYESED